MDSFPSANSVKDFDIPRLLHIQPRLLCGPAKQIDNTLVLSTDRLTYDSNEIQQIKASLTGDALHLPSTLQWVSGSLANDISGVPHGCDEILVITNIAATTIQISQINMRLTADTQPNRAHYRLINTCSIAAVQAVGCGPQGGGPILYSSDYLLNPGKANTIFSGHFKVESSTGRSGAILSSLPTLDPGQITFIDLYFEPKGIPGNFIYTITPEIILNAENTENKVNLPQLSATVAFANADQFTCYNLQGNTFVPTKFAVEDSFQPSSTRCT